MVHRSPARFLAPLALLACIGALFVIVARPNGGPADEREASPARTTTTEREGGTSSKGKRGRRRGSRFYRVRPGDTPSGIAEKTGVPLETLRKLNPDLDPQTLNPGVRLRLRR